MLLFFYFSLKFALLRTHDSCLVHAERQKTEPKLVLILLSEDRVLSGQPPLGSRQSPPRLRERCVSQRILKP